MRTDLFEVVRSLSRTPVLSALVIVTLGLGIGMNAAIFSVVNAVLLRPLAYHEPDRLVHVRARFSKDKIEDTLVPGGVFAAVRSGSRQLADVTAVAAIRQNLTGLELPVQVQVGWASPNLFRLLGVRPGLGRDFAPDEPAGRLILGHAFWRRQFAEDPTAIGRTVSLDGHPYEIVGVLPAGFRLAMPRLPDEIDLWKTPDTWWQNGDVWASSDASAGILRLLGRLAPGATALSAGDELAAISARLREGSAEMGRAGLAIAIDPLQQALVARVRPTLWLLLGAAGAVLLVACANVMSLQLVRGRRRAREIALRLALGGSRSRILRLLLLESLALACMGALLGLALGRQGLRVLEALRPADLPRTGEIRLDAGVLGFALLLALGATLLFGLAPALAATRPDVARELRGVRASADPRSQRAIAMLVAGQIALSLALLVSGGLLASSLLRLHSVPAGFDAQHLLTFSVSLPGTRYERPLGTDAFLRRLESAIETLPGVDSAGAIWPLPLSGRRWSAEYTAGAIDAGARAYADYRLASPGLFEALGTPILDGRSFLETDPRQSVVVSRRLAERAFPGQSAVGRARAANPWGGDTTFTESFRIVGVVGDVRYRSLREPPVETIYFDSRGWSWTDWEIDMVVRASGDAAALVAPIRAEIARLDAQVPMAQVRLMTDYLADDLAAHRFTLTLLGAFAGVALVLACVGLYGVLSHAVSERTREIGIRLALGATPSRILCRVVGQGLAVSAAGVLVGLGIAAAAGRLLQGLLYEVGPAEPAVLAAVTAVLIVAALLAAYLPARRAAAVDPVLTLRAE